MGVCVGHPPPVKRRTRVLVAGARDRGARAQGEGPRGHVRPRRVRRGSVAHTLARARAHTHTHTHTHTRTRTRTRTHAHPFFRAAFTRTHTHTHTHIHTRTHAHTHTPVVSRRIHTHTHAHTHTRTRAFYSRRVAPRSPSRGAHTKPPCHARAASRSPRSFELFAPGSFALRSRPDGRR